MASTAGLTPPCAPMHQGEGGSCEAAGDSDTLKWGQSRSEWLQALAGIAGDRPQAGRQGRLGTPGGMGKRGAPWSPPGAPGSPASAASQTVVSGNSLLTRKALSFL